MKKHVIRNKKTRYAWITAALTVAVIAVTVLANVVVSTLVNRYGWYSNLVGPAPFAVSEDCYALLADTFDEAKRNGGNTDVKIIFCNTEKDVRDESNPNYYLYHTVQELMTRFDNIDVEYVDIYTNPSEQLRDYTVSIHPTEGEIETPLYPTSVIVTAGDDYHRVYSWQDFYAYTTESSETPWGYNGEKKMTAALMRAVDTEERIACLLLNHGETINDYEMLSLLTDAGYTVLPLDLYKEKIPAGCSLLISCNPITDLVNDDVSEKNEVAILESFLSVPGHSFYVFMDNGTPSLPNFEGFLGDWGVTAKWHTSNSVSYRYMVQDPTQTLTSDGYTIYGERAEGANETFASDANFVVFRNATALDHAENYIIDKNSNGYKSGNRTMYPLYESGPDTVSWANGTSVAGGSEIMATLTEQKHEGGSSYVGVFSSVGFVKSEFLQSAVYGNSDVLLHLLGETGKTSTPEGLDPLPFNDHSISTVTTSQMLSWTLALTVTPAVLFIAIATVILVKRRRA